MKIIPVEHNLKWNLENDLNQTDVTNIEKLNINFYCHMNELCHFHSIIIFPISLSELEHYEKQNNNQQQKIEMINSAASPQFCHGFYILFQGESNDKSSQNFILYY